MAGIWLLVAWGCLAFGAVYAWAFAPLLVGCAIVGVFGLAMAGTFQRSQMALLAGVVLVAGACAIQLAPLSREALLRVTPSTDRFLTQYDIGYSTAVAVDGPQARHPLSVAPARTLLAFGFIVALGVFLVGAARLLSPRDSRALAGAVCTLGAVVALIGIVQQPLYSGRIYGFWAPENANSSPYGPFVNRHHFAGWMLMALPLSWGFLAETAERSMAQVKGGFRERLIWWSTRSGAQLVLAGFGTILMGSALVLTMSRSGILAFLVGLSTGTVFVIHRRTGTRKRALVLAYLAILATVSLGVTGLDTVVTRFADQGISLQDRVAIWRDTIDVVRRFPLTGTGLNTFGTTMIVYQTVDRDEHLNESHNDYLQLAAEGGLLVALPAATLLITFVVIASRALASSRAAPDYWVRAGAVTGLISIAVQELADFSLQMPGNAVLFTILCAIAVRSVDPTVTAFARHLRMSDVAAKSTTLSLRRMPPRSRPDTSAHGVR